MLDPKRAILPRVGQIHLSLPPEQGEQFGRQVNYFVVRSEDTTPASAVEAFRAAYGPEPSRLRILFLADEPSEALRLEMMRYDSSSETVLCFGDGDVGHPIEGSTRACANRGCPFAKDGSCRELLTMNFAVLHPERDELVGGFGVWTLQSGNKGNVERAYGQFKAFAPFKDTVRVSEIPMWMRLEEFRLGDKTAWGVGFEILQPPIAMLDIRSLLFLGAPATPAPRDLFPTARPRVAPIQGPVEPAPVGDKDPIPWPEQKGKDGAAPPADPPAALDYVSPVVEAESERRGVSTASPTPTPAPALASPPNAASRPVAARPAARPAPAPSANGRSAAPGAAPAAGPPQAPTRAPAPQGTPRPASAPGGRPAAARPAPAPNGAPRPAPAGNRAPNAAESGPASRPPQAAATPEASASQHTPDGEYPATVPGMGIDEVVTLAAAPWKRNGVVIAVYGRIQGESKAAKFRPATPEVARAMSGLVANGSYTLEISEDGKAGEVSQYLVLSVQPSNS